MQRLISELRRHWYWYVPALLVYALAVRRVLYDPANVPLPLLWNSTPSLPYKLAWARYGQAEYGKGEFIIYHFNGNAAARIPGLKGKPFFKIVRGLPGDVVSVKGRQVYVNGEAVGRAKEYVNRTIALDPIAPVVIPPGHFYVQGTSPDSFDSRYALSGLVRREHIIAAVTPLF